MYNFKTGKGSWRKSTGVCKMTDMLQDVHRGVAGVQVVTSMRVTQGTRDLMFY